MKEFHTFTIFGRIARVQELRKVGDSQVLNFVIAQTTKYRDKEFTTYADASIWGELAEEYGYLHTGMQVAAIGTVKAEAYQHKGEHKAKLVLRVNSLAAGGTDRSY